MGTVTSNVTSFTSPGSKVKLSSTSIHDDNEYCPDPSGKNWGVPSSSFVKKSSISVVTSIFSLNGFAT